MRNYATLVLLVAIMLVISNQNGTIPSQAAVGGSMESSTSLSLSGNQLTQGDPLTLSATSTFSFGPVFSGIHSYYLLNPGTQLGSIQTTTTQTVASPVISFSINSPTTLWLLRLPIVDISGTLSSSLTWEVFDNLENPALINGFIDPATRDQMVVDNMLYLAVNSFQTQYIDWSSGLSLGTGTYYLKLSITGSPQFVFDTQGSLDGSIELLDGSTSTNDSPLLFLHEGMFLSDQATDGSGTSSIVINPSAGLYDVFVYYGDGSVNFAGSYAIDNVDVISVSSPTVAIADMTGSKGLVVEFIANVNDGNPVVGADVDFFIKTLETFRFIGRATTGSGGVASLFYTLLEDIGIYEYKADTTVAGNRGSYQALLTVQIPVASWSNLDAQGTFNSIGNNQTQLNVNGNVIDANGDGVLGVNVQLYQGGSLRNESLTDGTGYFAFILPSSLEMSLYPDYFTLVLDDADWVLANTTLDLTIAKGTLLLNADDVSVMFDQQPASIVGTVVDTFGAGVAHDVMLQEQNGQVWQTIETQYNTQSFNFSLPQINAGQYVYRLAVPDSGSFIATSTLVNVNIGKAIATLSREALPSLVIIEYHGTEDLSVRATRSDGSPIGGAIIEAQYLDIPQGLFVILGNYTTDTNGWAIIYWTPEESLFATAFFATDFLYNLYDDNYELASLAIQYELRPTDLLFDIELDSQPVYESGSSITVSAVDAYGIVGEQGTQLTLTVESIPYTLYLDANGQASVVHVFAIVGDQIITVEYTQLSGIYKLSSQNFQIQVNRGGIGISGGNVLASRGEFLDLSILVVNHNGQAVSGISIDVFIDSGVIEQIGTMNISSGMGSLSWLVDYAVGSYALSYQFAGNSWYNSSLSSYSFDVDTVLSQINGNANATWIYGGPEADRTITFDVQVLNLNTPISGQSIDIAIGLDQWSIISDANGKASFILPQFYQTGPHTLLYTIADNGTLLGDAGSLEFTILGSAISIEWIQLPQDTYYGDASTFSFRVLDEYSIPLPAINVSVQIGFETFSYQTHANGVVVVDEMISHPYDLVDINIDIAGQEGWNPYSETIQINNPQRTYQVEVVDGTTVYGNQTSIAFNVTDNDGNQWSDIRVDVYVYDDSISGYIWGDTLVTDVNGEVSYSTVFPLKDAGGTYMIRYKLSHPQFINTTFDQLITIQQQELQISIGYDDAAINSNNPISFTLNDPNGLVVNNVSIDMVYVDLVVLWSGSATVDNGTATIFFEPVGAGNILLYYTLTDGNDNYNAIYGNFTIVVLRDTVSIDYVFDDTDGTLNVLVDMYSNNAQTAIMGQVVDLYAFDGNDWIMISTNTLSSPSYPIVLDLSFSQFRLVLLQNERFEMFMVEFGVVLQDPAISSDDKTVKMNQSIVIDVQLFGNGTGDGYVMDVYQTFIGQPYQDGLLLGTIYSFNGTFYQSFLISSVPGVYQLHLIFPQQGYYMSTEFTMALTVEQVQLVISPINLEVNTNIQDTIKFSFVNPGVDLQGTSIDLYLIDGGRVLLANGIIDLQSQTITFSFIVTLDVNTHDVELSFSGNKYIEAMDLQFSIIVSQKTSIELNVFDDISIDYGGIIQAYLYDDFTLIGLADEQLDLFVMIDGEKIFLMSQITDSQGYANFSIPSNIADTLSIEFVVEYAIQEFFGSSSRSLLLQLVPGEISIVAQVQNNGITNNVTIEVNVSSPTLISISGSLQWSLNTLSGTEIISGVVEMQDSYVLVIEAEYVGSYVIVLDFVPSSPIDQSTRIVNQLLLDVQWEKIQETQIVAHSTQVMYLAEDDTIRLDLFSINGMENASLNAIPIRLTILELNKTWLGTTSLNGEIIFDLDPTFPPGEYTLRIEILENDFVANQIHDITIQVNQAQFSFSLDIDDAVISGRNFRVAIDDPYNETSFYEIRILDGDGTIVFQGQQSAALMSLNYIDLLAVDMQIDLLPPGQYTLEIVRLRLFFDLEVVQQDLQILPIPVEISLDSRFDSNTVIFEILVQFSPLDEGAQYPLFQVNLTYSGIEQSFLLDLSVGSQFSVELIGEGTMFIEINAIDMYQGNYEEVLPYTFPIIEETTSNSTTTTTSDDATTASSDQSSFPIRPEYMFMGVIGLIGGFVIVRRR